MEIFRSWLAGASYVQKELFFREKLTVGIKESIFGYTKVPI